MDIEVARKNMIDNQVRPWEVFDQGVLDVMQRIPREHFVPREYRALAFSDCNIPIGYGEVMMTPKVEARMLQTLAIAPIDRALEIGTGTGFVTALLAALSASVVSIDIRPEFIERARAALDALGIGNADLRVADGARGYAESGPYDVVAITGSLITFDPHLVDMLNVGGRMFVIVGATPIMDARLVTKLTDHEWSQESLFETDLPPLQGAPVPDAFKF